MHFNKEEIIDLLKAKFDEMDRWIEQIDTTQFRLALDKEKWSPAQHLHHLIKSTKSVNKALKMPKLVLKTMFGTNNRTERDYDEIVTKYQNKLKNVKVVQPKGFQPLPNEDLSKERMISSFEKEFKVMSKLLDKWNEEQLSKFILPHPALGKMTIREILYFTLYHSEHHFKHFKALKGDK